MANTYLSTLTSELKGGIKELMYIHWLLNDFLSDYNNIEGIKDIPSTAVVELVKNTIESIEKSKESVERVIEFVREVNQGE